MKRRILIIFSALLLPMAVLSLTATQAAQAAKPPSPALTWSPSANYDFGTLTSGTKSADFTLSYSGNPPSGNVKVTVSGSGFSIPENGNGCAGKSLRSGDSCTVSVQYAFTTAGQENNGTLSATAKKLSAIVQLTGKSASASSDPNLTIGSPAVFTGKSGVTNNYTYYTPTSVDMYFTVTNAGDVTATIKDVYPVIVSPWGGGYSWPIGCTETTLNPGDSCSFRVELAIAPGDIPGEMDYRVVSSDAQATVYAKLAVTFPSCGTNCTASSGQSAR